MAALARAAMLAWAVLAAAGLGACGGAGTATGPGSASPAVSATAYVGALCGAIRPFEHDVASRSSALSGAAAASPAAGRAELTGYLGALAEDGHRAVTRLNAAGHPTVPGGARFASEILVTFRRLDVALTRSVGLARQLPHDDPAAFRTGAATLAGAVKQSLVSLGAGLSTQTNRGLDRVAARVAACHTL